MREEQGTSPAVGEEVRLTEEPLDEQMRLMAVLA